MKRSLFILPCIISCCIWLNSCYRDNEEELYPAATVCDTSAVSYQNDIVPILSTSCYGCHAGATPTGGRAFDSYQTFAGVTSDANAQFFCRIKWESGCSPMPQGGSQLSQCSIIKIEAWVNQGSPNN